MERGRGNETEQGARSMSKSGFLERLVADRGRLLGIINGLTTEAMETSEAAGEWSCKEVLVHIAAWEREAVKATHQTLQGQRPEILDIEDFDAWNDRQVCLWKHASVDEVRREFSAAREAVLTAIEGLEAIHFESPQAFPLLGGSSLEQILDWRHDQEHVPGLRSWRRLRDGSEKRRGV
jgi:hypothetical protein